MAEMVMINPAMIRSAHADGRQVFAWFGRVENPVTMWMPPGLGVDGLTVDGQRASRKVLGRRGIRPARAGRGRSLGARRVLHDTRLDGVPSISARQRAFGSRQQP